MNSQSPGRSHDLSGYLDNSARESCILAVQQKINELNIDSIYFQYVSITGRVMGKLIPARHWQRIAHTGMQTWLGGVTNVFTNLKGNLLGYPPHASELLALPDPDTFCQLPWNKRLARVFCTLFYSREDPNNPEAFLDADSRGNLRRMHKRFEDTHGLHLRVGCEPEMLWLKPGDDKAPYYGTSKPYAYHIEQLETLSHVWLKVADYARAMGLDLIQGDHEDAPGQVELNFQFDDPLRTSDRLTTYRQICAQVAREFGLLAVFMTKPYMGMPANGCHHNLSLWRGGDDAIVNLGHEPQPAVDEVFTYRSGGENVFRDLKEQWLPSEIGRWCVGGMLAHLDALVAIGASTVNSYRRLNDTGLWAPVGHSWGLQNRSCAIRASAPDRLEFRCADSMVNPYLLQCALLATFDHGLREHIEPGPPEARNFAEVVVSDPTARRIPTILRDALDALAIDEVVKGAMPGNLHAIYDEYKRDEWNRFIWQTSDWDVKTYLDCLP